MITITETALELALKTLLQRNLCFVINKKQWRKGRLLLFKQNGFYIEFVINNDNKQERFEVPIPFAIERSAKRLLFSYTLPSLICNRKDITEQIMQRGNTCKSKYFNNVLEINIS